jgi:hypothetical protein
MPAGRTIHLGDTKIGDYESQIWQRKNTWATEPFTTWLFARRRGDKWIPFMLDYEDDYRPSISLRRENARFAVFYGSTKFADIDETLRSLTRTSDGVVFTSQEVDYDPPGPTP